MAFWVDFYIYLLYNNYSLLQDFLIMPLQKAPILNINISNDNIDFTNIISLVEKQNLTPAQAYDPKKLQYYTPKNFKNSKNAKLENDSELAILLQSLFNKYIIEYIKKNDTNFNQYIQHEISIIKYGKDDYVKEHNDCGNIKFGDSIYNVAYSSLLYLNDSHGGELILDGEEINIKQGQFVTFPAETLHSVKKILSGSRYTVLFRLYTKI